MADHFYSNQLTPNADGTLASASHLGSGDRYGTTRKEHKIDIEIPIGTNFAIGDKIVIAIMPTDTKILRLFLGHAAWITGSQVEFGTYHVNTDGSVGEKVSANSHDMFGPVSTVYDLNTTPPAFNDQFQLKLDHYHRGVQWWEIINRIESLNSLPDVYTENPGGDFAFCASFTGDPAASIIVQNMWWQILYVSTGN